MTKEESMKYGVDPSAVLYPEDFENRNKPVTAIRPDAPTGDAFFDLMTGRGVRQDAPDGKWRIKKSL